MVDGSASAPAQAKGQPQPLARNGVLFLRQGDRFALTTQAEPVTLLRCFSLPREGRHPRKDDG